MTKHRSISAVSTRLDTKHRSYIAACYLAAIVVGVFFVGLHVDAAGKKEPPYTYKGSLISQIRWQCATDCLHGNKPVTGYENVKKCTEKCIKNPPRSTRELASQMQKECKKGPSDKDDRKFCQAISRGRDDFAEWMINKWNGTKDGCPLGAALKGKKCVCPPKTKLDKEHIKCIEDSASKRAQETINLLQDLTSPTLKKTKTQEEKKPLITKNAKDAKQAKMLEGTQVRFTFDPSGIETKYVACQTDAQCGGEYRCKEHYVTLRRVCGRRPEGKSCASKPEEAARDSRLFLCDAGDECVNGTCTKIASYSTLERSASAWKCDSDTVCQKAFGNGYYCMKFGEREKVCMRAAAPSVGHCLQLGCPDSNDSCVIMPSSATACLRTAP